MAEFALRGRVSRTNKNACSNSASVTVVDIHTHLDGLDDLFRLDDNSVIVQNFAFFHGRIVVIQGFFLK